MPAVQAHAAGPFPTTTRTWIAPPTPRRRYSITPLNSIVSPSGFQSPTLSRILAGALAIGGPFKVQFPYSSA